MTRLISYDLTAENDILRLPPVSSLGCVLAAAATMAGDVSLPAHETLFDRLVAHVERARPGVRHWLMAGHDAWQPRNRIVLHNRLWRSLSNRLPLPLGRRSEEFPVESPAGVRFFGFIECEPPFTRDVFAILGEERACTLVASWGADPTRDLAAMARIGWTRAHVGPPLEIAPAACRMDIGVYAILGDFDDRERGAAFIARPRWIETMFAQRGWQAEG